MKRQPNHMQVAKAAIDISGRKEILQGQFQRGEITLQDLSHQYLIGISSLKSILESIGIEHKKQKIDERTNEEVLADISKLTKEVANLTARMDRVFRELGIN